MNFLLRPWNINDLQSVCKHSINSKISNFMSDAFPDSVEKWKKFLDFAIRNPDILYLVIDINGEVAGGIGISPQKDIFRKNAELGYWLSELYWRKGIMTKAIAMIVDQAFQRFPEIDRIYATPFENNVASHRILEKNGFKLEARIEKNILKNGELLDELIYAIRRSNNL